MRPIKISRSITNRNEDSLNLYLLEIDKYPLLNSDEEVRLSRLVQMGDQQAANRLVEANLRFVVSVAKCHLCPGIALSDLVNSGNMGLIHAAGLFDPTRGFKFISFAVWWIRHFVATEIRNHLRTIRLPKSQLYDISKIRKIRDELEQLLEREPTDEEINLYANESIEKIKGLNTISSHIQSLDAPTSEEEGYSLLTELSDESSVPADHLVYKGSFSDEFVQYMSMVLPNRMQRILKWYYGLDGFEEKTLQDIASIFGITRERTRQLKDEGIHKMRRFYEEKNGYRN